MRCSHASRDSGARFPCERTGGGGECLRKDRYNASNRESDLNNWWSRAPDAVARARALHLRRRRGHSSVAYGKDQRIQHRLRVEGVSTRTDEADYAEFMFPGADSHIGKKGGYNS